MGDLQSVLLADSTYFAQLGESATDDQLLRFEEQKANDALATPILVDAVDSAVAEPGLPLTLERSFLQTISGRYQQGLLGRGWTTNWDIKITTDSSGDLFAEEGGQALAFTAQSDGTYVNQAVGARS